MILKNIYTYKIKFLSDKLENNKGMTLRSQ